MKVVYKKKKPSDKTFDVIVDGKKVGISSKPLGKEALQKLIDGPKKKKQCADC